MHGTGSLDALSTEKQRIREGARGLSAHLPTRAGVCGVHCMCYPPKGWRAVRIQDPPPPPPDPPKFSNPCFCNLRFQGKSVGTEGANFFLAS